MGEPLKLLFVEFCRAHGMLQYAVENTSNGISVGFFQSLSNLFIECFLKVKEMSPSGDVES